MNNIHFFDFGPSPKEIEFRDKMNLCFRVEFEDGDSFFSCNNIAIPYKYFRFPFKQEIYLKIRYCGLCEECLEEYSRFYGINFRQELPKIFINKGWRNNKDNNVLNYKLVKELQNKYNISKSIVNFIDNKEKIFQIY